MKFAVVRGSKRGVFDTYEEVKAAGGHRTEGVYKKMRAEDAQAWYERSLQLPLLICPGAYVVYVASACYDVTQDKDVYAAVGVSYNGGQRAYAYPANTCAADLDFLILLDVLKTLPFAHAKLSIFTSSKRIAYGLNYNLPYWPKHEFGDRKEEPRHLWAELRRMIADRAQAGQTVAFDWADDARGNHAHKAVLTCCVLQNRRGAYGFGRYVRREQCIAWVLCAKRARFHPDIRRLIARTLFNIEAWDATIGIPFIRDAAAEAPPK